MNKRLVLTLGWVCLLLALLSAGRPVAGSSGAGQAASEAAAQPAVAYPQTLLWQRCPSDPHYCETGWYASPAVADINHDGQPDVLWGGYTLMALNGANGHIEWNQPHTNNRLWPSIAVADLRGAGNGQLDVITGQSGGYVTAYDASGHVLPGWPQRPNSNEIRSLAVADLDGDHQQEIIVATTNGPSNTGGQHWWVYEPDGSLRPGWPRLKSGDPGYAAGAYNENIGVADLNGDGQAEIIGPSDVHYITAYHADGSQIASNPIFTHGQFWSQVGTNVSQVADLRGYTNCGVENRPNFANSAPTLADLLGNGTVQVVVVGNVYDCGGAYTDLYEMPFIFNGDRSRWAAGGYNWVDIPTPDAHAAPLSEDYGVIENSLPNPVAADLDGGGQKEILYASYDGRVHAYWLDKTEHGHWPFQVDQHGSEGFYRFASEPVVADLNGDGQAEVIFASWTQHGSNRAGKLYIVSWDGNLIESFDLPRASDSDYGGSLAAPTLAHLDGDPNLDVVIGTVDMGVVAYRLGNTANAQLLWPTGRGNLGRTGATLSGSLSSSTKSVAPLLTGPGGVLTYTLRLVDPGPLLASARLTDTLPANAALLTGTLHASSGSLFAGAGLIRWSGPVSATSPVTITYLMAVSGALSQPAALINTALFDDGLGRVLTRQAAAYVNGRQFWLPVVKR